MKSRLRAEWAYTVQAPLFVLYDHRKKIFIACDNGVVTFAVLVFHMPDIARPNIPELSVAGGHTYRARQADELLSDRRGMNWLIPTRPEPQKHGLRDGFWLRDLDRFRGRRKGLLFEAYVDVFPMAFALRIRIQLLELHFGAPAT